MKIVIVTGLSGAGKSAALNIFEDMGFYCMDNLPPQLIQNFIELTRHSRKPVEKLAVVVDIRGGMFFDDLFDAMDRLDRSTIDLSVLFLDASDEVLVARYKQLRRIHPMTKSGNIIEGIRGERQVLKKIEGMANYKIDTSFLTLGELKRSIIQRYGERKDEDELIISVVSFGYKHGVPLDSDLVFDVRFLPNPFYIEGLRNQTGLDPGVVEYVFSGEDAGIFLEKLEDMLRFLIPLYLHEGKSSLTIGIGCTGGRHRSPAIAEALGSILKKYSSVVDVVHRDRGMWDSEEQ